jgi:hypothetical protein
VVELMHQGKETADLAFGKTFPGEPVQIVARKVGDKAPLVFAVRHASAKQQFQVVGIHRDSVVEPGLTRTGRANRSASASRQQLGIPHHFPKMSIRVLEVTGIAAPERVLSRLHDGGARLLGLVHDVVHFLFA